MQNILPSKKILSILIISIAFVASIIIAFGKNKTGKAINIASNIIAGETISLPENSDWQAELSKLENTKLLKNVSSTTEKTTLTDTVSQSFMSNYWAMRESGSLNKDSANKLIEQTVDFIDKNNTNLPLVSKLNISSKNDIEAMRQYGENLGTILKNSKPISYQNELEILVEAVKSRDDSKLKDLDNILLIYENLTDKLIKMRVPKIFLNSHIDMVNGLIAITTSIKDMRNAFGDPFKALSSMEAYQNGGILFKEAFVATRLFISKNNIDYKQGSGGYYLLNGI